MPSEELRRLLTINCRKLQNKKWGIEMRCNCLGSKSGHDKGCPLAADLITEPTEVEGDPMSTYERLPDGSWRTAIPEPYWYCGWKTLWRYRPACYNCRTIFGTRQRYEDHYIAGHAYQEGNS